MGIRREDRRCRRHGFLGWHLSPSVSWRGLNAAADERRDDIDVVRSEGKRRSPLRGLT
jgi:hypothetical protein